MISDGTLLSTACPWKLDLRRGLLSTVLPAPGGETSDGTPVLTVLHAPWGETPAPITRLNVERTEALPATLCDRACCWRSSRSGVPESAILWAWLAVLKQF